MTVGVRNKPSYKLPIEVHMVDNIKKIIDADINDNSMKPIIDYLSKGIVLSLTTEAHMIRIN